VLVLGTFALLAKLAVAQLPSPALLITYWGKELASPKGLEIADPKTGKIVANVPISCKGWPHLVVASADGKLAFVSVMFYAHDFKDPNQVLNGYISVIDLETLKERRCVELGPDSVPHGLFFGGGKLYFTAEGQQLIERYDPATDKIEWRMGMSGMGGHMLAVNKEATKFFTANSVTDIVTVLEPWDHQGNRGPHVTFHPWMQTVIRVGEGPEGISMSPDEKEVWTAGRRDGSLSIIDVATKKVSQTIGLEIKDPVRLKFTPDGGRVLISDMETGDLLIFDAASRKQLKRIKSLGLSPHDIAFSPDSSRAYISAHKETHVSIVDLNQLELAGRISTEFGPEGLAWVETRH
jgi:YVTN family beta-propeller protein